MALQPSTALPQNMYQLKILKIFPPDTPPEQIKIAVQKTDKPELQLAEVKTITPGGQPIFKTVDGAADRNFVIKTPVNVPVGSTVLFEAAPMTPEAGNQDIFPASGFRLLGNAWPNLHEALQVIQQADPSAAQALRNSLPTPSAHLAPATLFFLAALRLGSIDNWLGDNALKALRAAGKKDLLERLGGDFGKISGQSREILADEWRSISVPLLHDEQISQMQFYIRRHRDQGGAGKDHEQKPMTRFVLNLHLSRMGDMQLDGLIRKKHFDIVLRTEEKLPFDMRQELMRRFAQGLDQVQMQGGISFQTRQQGWVTVPAAQQKGALV